MYGEKNSNKVIDDQLVTDLLKLLAEYKVNESNKEGFSKVFYGKLFFLFSTLVNFAKYSGYNAEHMDQIYRLRVGIMDLFSDVI